MPPTADGRRRPPTGGVVVIAATAAVAATVLLPWARSGARSRDAFELIDLTRRLGLADAGWERALLWAAALLPAQVGAAVVAVSLHRTRVAGAICAVAGAVAIAGAVVVWRTPLDTEVGPTIACALGGLAVLAGAGVSLGWPRSTVVGASPPEVESRTL